jgi:hypothetical protein
MSSTLQAFGPSHARNFFTLLPHWTSDEIEDERNSGVQIMTGARNVYENSYLAYWDEKYKPIPKVQVFTAEGTFVEGFKLPEKRTSKSVLEAKTVGSLAFLSEWMCDHFHKFDFQTLLNDQYPEAGAWAHTHLFMHGHLLPRNMYSPVDVITLPGPSKKGRTSGVARADPRHAAESPAPRLGGRVKAVAVAGPSGAGAGAGPSGAGAGAGPSGAGAGRGRGGPGPNRQRGFSKRTVPVVVSSSSDDEEAVAAGAGRNQPLSKRGGKVVNPVRRNPPAGSGPVVREDIDDDAKRLGMECDVLVLKKNVEIYVETQTLDGRVSIVTYFAIESNDEKSNEDAQNDPNVVHWREYVEAKGYPTYTDVFDRKNGGLQMSVWDLKEFEPAKSPINGDYENKQISKSSLLKRAELVETAYLMFDEFIRGQDPNARYKNDFGTFQTLLDGFMKDNIIHDFVQKREAERETREQIDVINTFFHPFQVITDKNIDEFEKVVALLAKESVKAEIDYEKYKDTVYAICRNSPKEWSMYLSDETVKNTCERMNEWIHRIGMNRINTHALMMNRNQLIEDCNRLKNFKLARYQEETFWGYSYKQRLQGWPGPWEDMKDQVALYESYKTHLHTVEATLTVEQEEKQKLHADIEKMVEENAALKKELEAARAALAVVGAAPAPVMAPPAAPVVDGAAPAPVMAPPVDPAPVMAPPAGPAPVMAPPIDLAAPAPVMAPPAAPVVDGAAPAPASPASPASPPSDEEKKSSDEDENEDEDEDENEDEEENEDKARIVGTKVSASKAGLPPPVDKKSRLLEEVEDSQPTQAAGLAMSPRAARHLMPAPSVPQFTRNGSPIPEIGPKSLPPSRRSSPPPTGRRMSARASVPREYHDPDAYGKRGGRLTPKP